MAEALSQRLGDDGVLYILGCGHSQLLALEGFYRAGAPAWVAPLVDARVSPVRGAAAIAAENQPGLGRELVARLEEPSSKARALVVVSSSGHTPAAIEAATAAREMGLLTIGITGVSKGNPLMAHLDHALLTGVSRRDASVRIGVQMMSPQSTSRRGGTAPLPVRRNRGTATTEERPRLGQPRRWRGSQPSAHRALSPPRSRLSLRAGLATADPGRRHRRSRDRHGAGSGHLDTSTR